MPALRLAGFLNETQLSHLHTNPSTTLQVLDDSTDKATRDLVDDKCLEWRERGVLVTCLRRTNRQGYKAGALKEVGMCAVSRCSNLYSVSCCREPLPSVLLISCRAWNSWLSMTMWASLTLTSSRSLTFWCASWVSKSAHA